MLNLRITAALLALSVCPAFSAPTPLERHVYAPANLLVPTEVERVEKLMGRAKAAGFTHVLIADSKFSRLNEMEARYFRNVDRVKARAKDLGLTLIPAVFPVGYSNDILGQDPNLAEGLPVRDALFTVKGGEARVTADPAVSLPAFSERKKWGFIDDNLKPDGAAGVKLTNGGGSNARAMIRVKTAPFRCYHASVRIRTEGFNGAPEIKALAAGKDGGLSFTYLKAKPTQDWTTHEITFNSLENPEVNLYFGVWGAGAGTLQMADPAIEEAGPVNLLRRPGCPLKVTTEDGRALREGTDFEPLADPKTGNQPYGGEYEVWHEAPPLKTKLPDGTRLRVSWYHPHIVYDGQVCGAVGEPAFMALLRDQARRVHDAFDAPGYMMSHDEWRVLGWDECSPGKTPGEVMAENLKTCTGYLREVNPGGTAYVWSDMFDPHHNARKEYYLVKGDLTGSWTGLERDVVVMNWNFDHRVESLAFFSGRGNRQILCGYYDAGPDQINDWLKAARDVPGVTGVMYTTWVRNYADLEAFSANVTAWEKTR